MGVLNFFKKKEGNEAGPAPATGAASTEVPEAEAAEQMEKQEKERVKKENFNKFLMRMASLAERVDLIEKKIDRIELKIGVKNAQQDESK